MEKAIILNMGSVKTTLLQMQIFCKELRSGGEGKGLRESSVSWHVGVWKNKGWGNKANKSRSDRRTWHPFPAQASDVSIPLPTRRICVMIHPGVVTSHDWSHAVPFGNHLGGGTRGRIISHSSLVF